MWLPYWTSTHDSHSGGRKSVRKIPESHGIQEHSARAAQSAVVKVLQLQLHNVKASLRREVGGEEGQGGRV